MTADVTLGLISSAAGFVLGYITCLLVRRTVELQDSPRPEATRRAQLARTLFGVLLIVMAAMTFIDSQQANQCFRDAIERRDQITTDSLANEIELFTTDPQSAPEERRAAIDRYVQGLRDQLRIRSENPLECE